MNHGVMVQKHHRFLPSPALKWFKLHFQSSGFNGRFQIGIRGPRSSAILPLTTQSMDQLHEFVETAHFSGRLDYYITANAFSGVNRQKQELFSLHNIVIDIDVHNQEQTFFYDNSSIQAFASRLKGITATTDQWDDDLLPSPTSIVWTGRGLQLWWAIVPMSYKCLTWYEEIRNCFISRITNLIEDYPDELCDLKVDASASRNVVGYFRLPGTINSKSQSLAVPEIWSGIQYDTHLLIKWAKQYQKEREQLAPSPATYSDVDPFRYSDVEVRILKSVFTLAFFRVRQIIRLRTLRNNDIGDETRNNMCLIVYNAFLLAYGENTAWEKVMDFNSGFKNPMTEKELHQSLDTSTKRGGYRFKNETVVKFLNISTDEQEAIELYGSNNADMPMTRMSSHPSRTACRRLAKQVRNQKIRNLSAEGKKNYEIAAEVGIDPNTVTSVLGAKKPRRKEAIAMKAAGMSPSDIAEELGVCRRTVERYLSTHDESQTDSQNTTFDNKNEQDFQAQRVSESDMETGKEIETSQKDAASRMLMHFHLRYGTMINTKVRKSDNISPKSEQNHSPSIDDDS